jgi:NAD(P)-dependent dehydrogenase (short-subunit alcohol dehydrogenase family)
VEIKDKVVIVTGAAKRVGRAIALSLAKKGVHVAITYHTESGPWRETLAEIRSHGVEGLALPMDVRQPEQIESGMQEIIDHFGRVDILVNNASVFLSAPFLEITRAQWDESLAVNLTGPFLCSQVVAPTMLQQQSGLIVNITDLSAFQVWPRYAHHAASKAGLVILTQVMAAELAPHVRVNGIAPGTVLLPDGAGEQKQRWAAEKSLLKRVGTPEDVAETVVFLAEMDFITGTVLTVDGGQALV